MADSTTPLLINSPAATLSKPRLVCLDAVRGLTVAVMIFVDDAGGFLADHVDHSPWNNVTFADFVMPFFLFMVGTSMSFSLRNYSGNQLLKVVIRTIKLFIIGLLTQGTVYGIGFPDPGNPGFDLRRIRIPGILQRIAWAYLVVGLMAIYLPKYSKKLDRRAKFHEIPYSKNTRWLSVYRFLLPHWICALLAMVIYLCIVFLLHVPDYDFTDPVTHTTYIVNCDTRGDLSPACNAGRELDRLLIGWEHMYPHPMYVRSHECSSCFPSLCPREDAPDWCGVPQVCFAWLHVSARVQPCKDSLLLRTAPHAPMPNTVPHPGSRRHACFHPDHHHGVSRPALWHCACTDQTARGASFAVDAALDSAFWPWACTALLGMAHEQADVDPFICFLHGRLHRLLSDLLLRPVGLDSVAARVVLTRSRSLWHQVEIYVHFAPVCLGRKEHLFRLHHGCGGCFRICCQVLLVEGAPEQSHSACLQAHFLRQSTGCRRARRRVFNVSWWHV
eukprot:m.85271 g.85271  ORF g.85271 m.85271 type:complete len:501 (+) comp8378_c0_seq5:63-1565(+)